MTAKDLEAADTPTKDLSQPPVMTETTPTRTHRFRPWIAALSAIVLVLVGAFAVRYVTNGNGDDNAGCATGVRWRQQPTTIPDRTLIGIQPGPHVAIVLGGARIGFPNAAEFSAMGYTTFNEISRRKFNSLDLVPRAGMLLRERSIPGSPGRYYYSAGGAVFQVRDLNSLRALKIDPARATSIPRFGLDGAARIPPNAALLREAGEHRVWQIKRATRVVARNVCSGAAIVTIPRDAQILADIPAASTGAG